MRVAFAILLAGCGAAGSQTASDVTACDRAGRAARDAWSELAAQLVVPEGANGATPIDGALAQLAEHVASVHAHPPEEIDSQTAMALSSAVMDAVDALPGALPDSFRARADDAAEALLTDRTPGGSVQAARTAADALEAALLATDPSVAATRTTAITSEALRRQAQSAADGYADDPRVGDLRAARAESVDAPPSLPARTAAVDASREVRVACGFSRVLAVPSP